jgi:hypothetical protein
VVSSPGHPRPGRKARATAIIAESIFDFQWTFERRGKIFREIAALVIDLDDKERKEPKDAVLQVHATPAGSASWGSAPSC